MRTPYTHYVLALGFALGPASHALAQDPTFTTIDFPGATRTFAFKINPSGDIVGQYLTADGVIHGYLLSGGEFTTIDFPGATSSSAHANNAQGDIVGQYDTGDGVTHGYLLSNHQFSTIDFPGATLTLPEPITP